MPSFTWEERVWVPRTEEVETREAEQMQEEEYLCPQSNGLAWDYCSAAHGGGCTPDEEPMEVD